MTKKCFLFSVLLLDQRLIKHVAQIKQFEERCFTTGKRMNRSRLSRLRQARRLRSRLVIPSWALHLSGATETTPLRQH